MWSRVSSCFLCFFCLRPFVSVPQGPSNIMCWSEFELIGTCCTCNLRDSFHALTTKFCRNPSAQKHSFTQQQCFLRFKGLVRVFCVFCANPIHVFTRCFDFFHSRGKIGAKYMFLFDSKMNGLAGEKQILKFCWEKACRTTHE